MSFATQSIAKTLSVKVGPPQDLKELKKLFDACFGQNYLSQKYLQEFMDKPDGICVLVEQDGILIGALIAEKVKKLDEVLELLDPGHIWGKLKTGAVHPGYRGHGIASDMFQEAIHQLEVSGCDRIVAEAWKSHSPQNSLGTLERLGFKLLVEIPKYWTDVHGVAAPCIECGAKCKCTAVIMTRGS